MSSVSVASKASSFTTDEAGTQYGCVPIRGAFRALVCIWDAGQSFGVLTSMVTASPRSALELAQKVLETAT
jgi:hypothetical protein